MARVAPAAAVLVGVGAQAGWQAQPVGVLYDKS
jgi:hypothetical protein